MGGLGHNLDVAQLEPYRLFYQRGSDRKRQGLHTDPWGSSKSFCVTSSTKPWWQVRFIFTFLDLSGSVVPPWSRLYPLWI